jgi:hypothetical protein
MLSSENKFADPPFNMIGIRVGASEGLFKNEPTASNKMHKILIMMIVFA